MKSWFDFYKHKRNNGYFKYIQKRYKPFISILKKNIKSSNVVLEAGCGLCNITNIVFTKKKKFIVIDRSRNILQYAKTKAKKKLRNIVKPYKENPDLIHSHGVLEHLNDKEIKNTINEQLKVCPKLIHYVPSNKYTYKSYGDERLMSSKEWKKICNPDRIIKFNKGYDLILMWNRT